VPKRFLVALVGLSAVMGSLTACEFKSMVPPGDGPTRYRDAVFSQVTVTKGLTYGSAKTQSGVQQTLVLDLYQPTGDKVKARPAIVLVHGGNFAGGGRTEFDLVDQANVYAKQGFVVVSIDYRLSANGCWVVDAACVTSIIQAKEDAQASVRWLRRYAATYKIDTNRIAIGGTSAGAVTALNVGYEPALIGSSGNPGYSSRVRAAISLSGAALTSSPAAGEAAVLLFHGTKDNLVSYALAEQTVANAKKVGLRAELTTWVGDGHVPYSAHRSEILTQTTNFLWWTMELADAAR
jgi:carboxylesterase type B